jgi:hypothetical protein
MACFFAVLSALASAPCWCSEEAPAGSKLLAQACWLSSWPGVPDNDIQTTTSKISQTRGRSLITDDDGDTLARTPESS